MRCGGVFRIHEETATHSDHITALQLRHEVSCTRGQSPGVVHHICWAGHSCVLCSDKAELSPWQGVDHSRDASYAAMMGLSELMRDKALAEVGRGAGAAHGGLRAHGVNLCPPGGVAAMSEDTGAPLTPLHHGSPLSTPRPAPLAQAPSRQAFQLRRGVALVAFLASSLALSRHQAARMPIFTLSLT